MRTCYVCGEICIIEAGNFGDEASENLVSAEPEAEGSGLGFVCVLQLWDNDLGALWACPMDKCEYYKNGPSSSQLSRS